MSQSIGECVGGFSPRIPRALFDALSSEGQAEFLSDDVAESDENAWIKAIIELGMISVETASRLIAHGEIASS